MMKKFKSLDDLKSLIPENFQSENDTQSESKPINQNLEAHYSIKGRSGKPVTIIKGFKGDLSEIKKLSKLLKNHCNVGGSVKNFEIIIQGNNREKIISYLEKRGHFVKKVGG